MTSRKEQLKNLFQPVPQSGEVGPQEAVPQDAAPQRMASGAVKAMGLSLGGLQREVAQARQISEAALKREQIVDVHPDLIDPSPFVDRLCDGAHNDEAFDQLVQSLKDSGQQVPVLVRPHPVSSGRYQSAYGHRRIKAARLLGLEVKAIVRVLDDAALMLAQGQENAQRRDLSFIEKALFAKSMVDAGVDRAAAQAALGAHKADMTRYFQVADAIPVSIARAIGPAPKAGRPRWMALGELLATDAARRKAQDEIGNPAFVNAASDARFQMLFKRLSAQEPSGSQEHFVESAGIKIAIAKQAKATRFVVSDSGFATWLEANMGTLASRFAKGEAN